MQARVKPDYRYPYLQAFGLEFVKVEWRAVPVLNETAALNHPGLDTRPDPEEIPAPEPIKLPKKQGETPAEPPEEEAKAKPRKTKKE